MPRMNGLDAARTIREMKRRDAKRVPIIAMSANAFAEDIINSRLAGMNVHLAKPLDAEKIIIALKQCMADNSDVKHIKLLYVLFFYSLEEAYSSKVSSFSRQHCICDSKKRFNISF